MIIGEFKSGKIEQDEKTIREMIVRKIDRASPEVWTYIYELIELKENKAKKGMIKIEDEIKFLKDDCIWIGQDDEVDVEKTLFNIRERIKSLKELGEK